MVMIPNYPLNRPKQKICPFTCDLVQMRQVSVFGSYIYPVHVGGSFTLFPTLASTFYWIALQVGKEKDGKTRGGMGLKKTCLTLSWVCC